MTAYRVNERDAEGRSLETGLSYPPGRRAYPGEVVDDLPAMSVRRLLAAGVIEAVTDQEEEG